MRHAPTMTRGAATRDAAGAAAPWSNADIEGKPRHVGPQRYDRRSPAVSIRAIPRFEFREPRDEAETRALLALRARVYRGSRYRTYLTTAVGRRKFAAHDDRSRHFGVFEHVAGRTAAVGYLRVVECVLEDLTGLHADDALPCLDYVPEEDRPDVRRCLRNLIREYGVLVEPGRFAIDRDSVEPRLAPFMTESALAIYAHGLRVPAILGCHRSHVRFYRTLGFRWVHRHIPLAFPDSALMRIEPSDVPAQRTLHLDAMLAAYRRRGAIALYPDRPGVYMPPESHTRPSICQLAMRVA